MTECTGWDGFFFFKLRYNSLNRTKKSPFKVDNSVVFNVFTKLCNCHHCHSRTFSSPQKEILFPLAFTPHSLPTPKSSATHLLLVPIGVSVLDMSCKWNHLVHGLSCLPSVSYYDIFRVHHVVACITTLFFFMAE